MTPWPRDDPEEMFALVAVLCAVATGGCMKVQEEEEEEEGDEEEKKEKEKSRDGKRRVRRKRIKEEQRKEQEVDVVMRWGRVRGGEKVEDGS